MKILLIITGHQQLNEYFYNSFILKEQCGFLSENSDLFIHVNKNDIGHNLIDFYNMFPQKNKKLFITTKNEGYRLGGIEAISDIIDMNVCSEYDYVIHTHPDVIFTRDDIIKKHMEENLHNDTCFFITKSMPGDDNFFSFDFFMFKPKLLKINIFKTIDFYRYDSSPEHFLHDVIINNNINYTMIKRYNNEFWHPRRIDEHLGIWHEHDLYRLDLYISRDKNNSEDDKNNSEDDERARMAKARARMTKARERMTNKKNTPTSQFK